MAQKQKKRKGKRGILRAMLFYLGFPLLIWFAAFLIWFNWYNLTRFFGYSEQVAKPIGKTERKINKVENDSASPGGRSQEKLSDEDRRKLDEILKRRR